MLSVAVQAQSFRSDIDNFEVQLPETLYPLTLQYEERTALGPVQVKNISFHSNVGKFLIDVVDYPATDQRSPTQRMDGKLAQLMQNLYLELEQVEHFLSESSPGMMIKSHNGIADEILGMFVIGQREYHIRSESFDSENTVLVLQQTEDLIRSFHIATPQVGE
jgi:hypothetical protein